MYLGLRIAELKTQLQLNELARDEGKRAAPNQKIRRRTKRLGNEADAAFLVEIPDSR